MPLCSSSSVSQSFPHRDRNRQQPPQQTFRTPRSGTPCRPRSTRGAVPSASGISLHNYGNLDLTFSKRCVMLVPGEGSFAATKDGEMSLRPLAFAAASPGKVSARGLCGPRDSAFFREETGWFGSRRSIPDFSILTDSGRSSALRAACFPEPCGFSFLSGTEFDARTKIFFIKRGVFSWIRII